ncbi:hypothetical protein F8388_006573 [Cannabis sativa]|uniref:Dynamin-type G domain-containing protein n=1 Tax=Cannabis sativa TaxID=3483 RepID=A0A7J6HDL8_CANSA|nr:hypothetical protein F8388_006573 [Cannabis sativa]KAF4392961.1 hypothetical protein G4B88_011956 [Cannabis sativa]
MATTTNSSLITPTKTPSEKSQSARHHKRNHTMLESSSLSKSRFEAYNRLQAAAVAFGEKLPIPEIVALGGQSDGKSSLLEALLGFRFNVREVEMGTRRPLILQMVHDPTALEPRCRFQDEDSEEYGSPVVLASAIADIIKSRTDAILKKTKTAVSPKPIVMRAEYAHCPNLTIIDTPGFVLKAKKGEPENTPDEILSMVKSLASPPHRILLFLQQSSVEWCSSLWLDAIRDIDPTFRRTVIVVSKFDNRLKEFSDRWEVDRYLSASGYLGDSTHPFFVALPKDRNTISNDEFRRQISQVDTEVIRHLREGVAGGFDEEKFRPYIGFSCLREYLESELQRRYKEAAPATLALLEQRSSEVTTELSRMDSKIQATSDVSQLRRFAMLYTASICNNVRGLIDGAADPAPEQWGKTTVEEQYESSIGGWPGVIAEIKPPNATLRLYGGAAFERVMHEFRCAAYSIECPPVSREKVANILLAHASRGGGAGATQAAAEIARAAARSWLAPLLDTACDRLAFVLGNLFDLALERNRNHDSESSVYKSNQCSVGWLSLELSDGGASGHEESAKDQENRPPEKSALQTTPGKGTEPRDALRECQLTVPETPSPDQPCDPTYGGAKELGNGADIGARKRCSRMTGNSRNTDHMRFQNGGGLLFGNRDGGVRPGSAYADICLSAAHHFSQIREVLVERNVASALNSGFLTPCRDGLVQAVELDLFAVNDEKFMDMFVAPGAIDVLQNEKQSLEKRQKILLSCLTEFKCVAQAL